MIANVVIDQFHKGGPIMWPMLLVMVVAVAVILDRIIWWALHSFQRDPAKLEQIYAALEDGKVTQASAAAKDSKDPVIKVLWHALNHRHASLEGALTVASGAELQKAGRFLVAMDTLITIAPLLGLMGTVLGIMRSFNAVGESGLEVSKVSGGIGEALIATACGLGVAIFVVLFYNYFGARVARLHFEIETAANNMEIMLKNAKRNDDE